MKKLWICGLCMAFLLTAIACSSSGSSSDDNKTVYGMVTSISGNEMVVSLGTYTSIAEAQTNSRPEFGASTGESQPVDANASATQAGKTAPTANTSNSAGGTQQNKMQPSDVQAAQNSTAQNATGAASGAPQTATQNASSNSESGTSAQDKKVFAANGETATYLIPVKTPVSITVNSNTVVTTFSRIAVNNILEIDLQKNESGELAISAIRIVG